MKSSSQRIRLPKPHPRRVMGFALVIASLIIGLVAVQSADERTSVVLAARDIAPGVAITAEDLTTGKVYLGSSQARYRTDVEPVIGSVSPVAIAAGELIPHFAEQSTLPVVSIPVRGLHLPSVMRGDRVDIWSTDLEFKRAEILVRGAAVADLGQASGAMSSLSLAVPPEQIEVLIVAAEEGAITVVRR